ncbi:type I secretion system permease/ATPase [Sulfurospirillum sp. T05]|uniref:Type I secretion system permease/ATPase n=1 Tax=Sulfurospirillum tamanense TaxID=2813362 RepID=A0ABS2WUS5_9BACT|nr:type I secretion system permease/ATPase [Sulfurospirillum tamanensis]MBN2965123.1 type I secretion system permease/ATPase [Sulfurospirillum tamanensis]
MPEEIINAVGIDPLLECLVIVAKLHGKPFSAESLIEGLPTAKGRAEPELFSIHGAKANFSRAAARAGFTSKVVKRELKQIPALVLPCILMLKDKQACILDAFDANKTHARIIVPECGEGETWVRVEDLEKEYLGFAFYLKRIYLQSERKDDVLEQRESKHWFWGTLWRSRKLYKDVLLASLVVNFFVLASPLFVMNVYDRVVPNNAVETLWVMAIGVAVVYLLDTVLKFLRAYFLEVAGKKSDIIMSSMIFEKVMALTMGVWPKSIGSFANNLKEFESIRSFFTSATVSTIIDLPFVVIFIVVIYFIGGSIVVVPLVVMLLLLGYALSIRQSLSKSIESAYKAAAQKNAILIESLSNIEMIKTMGATGRAQFQWEEASGEIAQKGLKTRIISNSISTITALLVQLNTVAVVVYGVYLIQDLSLTMGGLIATVILSSRAISPLGQIASLMANYQHTKTALTSLNDIMALPVDRPHGREYINREKFEGKIEFKNVTFTYPGALKPALENVSFVIQPKERVGIVGRIGSGKTTLEKLILGLYQPSSGSILIDDIDISQIDPADLRTHISYVSQDIVLANGTVKDNIAYKAPYATDEEILEAAKLAGVEEFIRQNPQGYEMEVGERGAALSGGQRQSIAIARAFLLDAPIVLLDEPTNSIDNTMEAKIRTHFARKFENKTIMLITHKTALLPLVDRLIILDNGKIVLDGPRDNVLKQLQGNGGARV